jgi:hypothetical protein
MRQILKRRRRLMVRAGWVVAVLAAFYMMPLAFEAPNVDQLRAHPVRTLAAVTETYIEGFGGDPTVAYTYTVGGDTYHGTGTGGELDNGDVLRLVPSDRVNIEYAATDPGLSCTCDARTAADWRMPHGNGLNIVSLGLLVPLIGMVVYGLKTRHAKRVATGQVPPKGWKMRRS